MRATLRSLPILTKALRKPACPQLGSFRSMATDAAAAPPTTFQLRDYQEDCIQAVIEHVKGGGKRMGVSLATGSGKTVIFTQLIERITHPTSPDATQTLILVHRRELVEQAARHCRLQYPDKIIDIEMASSAATGSADITVASIQSITSGDRIEKFDPSRFKLVLIDECHHAVSRSYLECLDHFKLLEVEERSPVLVGVSATMARFDGLKLGKVLDHIVYHRDYVDMINDNWLSPCNFTTVKTSVDLSQVQKASSGDFQIGELGRAVNTDEVNEVTVRAWMEKAGERKSTIVFCVHIAHVKALTQKFRDYGIDAQYITSDTILQVRRERLAAFKKGEFRVLVNCGVFTEGTDIPNIDCVLLARPTRSKNLLVQMIGRGMRLCPGKEDCHVIDMVGTIEKGIVTVPTLFGLDPSEMLENATIASMKEKAAELVQEAAPASGVNSGAPAEEPPLNITFVDYDNVWDLLADHREAMHIRRLSDFAWVTVGMDRYILCLRGGNYLKIEQESENNWTVTETQKLPFEITVRGKHMYTRPRVIIEKANSLTAAVQGADTFARSRCSRSFLLLNATWRDKPASEEQMRFLEKFQDWFGIEGEITKGQAGDMITKLKHGAIARFKKAEKERKKAMKLKSEDAKLERLRRREMVKVGRLE